MARKPLHVTCFIPSDKQQVVTTRGRSTPPQLVKEEQASLDTALKAAGLADGANSADLPAPAVHQMLDTIRKGLDKQEKDLPKLEGAMLLAEQLFHASGGSGSRFAAAGAAEASPQSVDMWQVRCTCMVVVCLHWSWKPTGQGGSAPTHTLFLFNNLLPVFLSFLPPACSPSLPQRAASLACCTFQVGPRSVQQAV